VEPQPAFINLPHALTIVSRLVYYLQDRSEPTPIEETQALETLAALDGILRPYSTDPPESTAVEVARNAAAPARVLVDEIERAGYRGDRLGQCVRNLFECLGLGDEGAELSLRVGEHPDSPLRP
jgi:hypothetical protein